MSANNLNRERGLELKAGVFVLIGLVFIAMMAFKFGRLGQGLFQQYYPITVSFPSADGLIKNSDVQLAGARIGYVSDKPVISAGGSGVTLPLKILDGVRIPRDTTFEVGSSGLLGDKFVLIKPKASFNVQAFNSNDPKQVLAPGETIEGSPPTGMLGKLQGAQGDALFDQLAAEVQKLTEVTDKVNNGILSAQNEKNITDTFANLKATTEHFDTVSTDLDGVVRDAKGTIDSAKVTLGTVGSAATDVRSALDTAKKTLESAQALLARAQTGNGLIATLLNDRKISDDLRALVQNLREHGILFYKNRAATPAAAASPAPGSRIDRQY
jgi:phospholipid/cholesterol/gamma-HCH transport system substrate-binding protein